MKLLLILTLLICSFNRLFAQIYLNTSNPSLEAEKKEKIAYFQGLEDDAFKNLVNCTNQCYEGLKTKHSHSTENTDVCKNSNPICKCECSCSTRYNSTMVSINSKRADWWKGILTREDQFKKLKFKELREEADKQKQQEAQQDIKTEQHVQNQLKNFNKINVETKLDEALAEQKRIYEQTQIDFSNAEIVADNAYQTAIANGRRTSGAMLDATLAGSGQFSSATNSLIYTGVGLSLSLLTHLNEKKEDKFEKELNYRMEVDRSRRIITVKEKFIKDALEINKYGFIDLISKDRYVVILLVPKNFNSELQKAYFSIIIKVIPYADGTYPLKNEIELKLIPCIDKSILPAMKVYTLYPIINVNKFQDEFSKKMGSGHLIYLKAELLNLINIPFYKASSIESEIDFWGDSIKKKVEKKDIKPIKKDKSFWNY